MTEDGPRELAQFADRLKRLRQRAGSPSLSRLAALTADLPQPLARSTISDKLTAKSLPDWEFVAAFLAACAAYAEQSGSPLPADAVDKADWDATHLRMLRAVDRTRSADRLAAAARAQLGRGDAAPAAADPAHEAGSSVVPRQLPAALRHFAGRAAAVRVLDGLLGEALAGATVVISAIIGTAGIGKTALAVHWAHRVADRFPDGQLYVNLRGFDPRGSPMSPAEAVRGFLDALEVPPQQVPTTVQAQAALYRSLLAGRRMLVVLDNARDAEQVRPLLPGAPGCLVVVTSRSELSDLVVAEDAHPVMLELLSDAEAHEMLASRLGAGRVSAEADAVDEIIALCARLPLALAVVAVRAAVRPGFPLNDLAEELRAARGGLSAFAGGPPATDVRSVFSWSYRRLSAGTAGLFRLLGSHPGPDLGVPAAAALAGTTVPRVRAQLRDLARANLVVEHIPHRYALHDLLRAYAIELSNADADADRHAALRRTLDHYLHTGVRAGRLLDPHLDQIELDPPAPGAAPECLTDHDHGVTWLAAEHRVMLALVPHATAAGFHTHAWQLARAAVTFLHMSDRWHEMIDMYRTALEAARSLGDKDVQARLHNGIGRAYGQIGRHEDAEVNLRRALELFGPLGDPVGRAHTHRTFVWLADHLRRPNEALAHAERALQLYQEAGHRVGYARMLNNIGWIRAQLGDHEATVDLCRQAVTVQQEIGDSSSEAHTWDSLGYAHHRLGQHGDAVACYRRATALFEQTTGVPREVAATLTRLGDVHLDAGDPSAARAAWQRAVEILDRLGDAGAHRIRAKLDWRRAHGRRRSRGPGVRELRVGGGRVDRANRSYGVGP